MLFFFYFYAEYLFVNFVLHWMLVSVDKNKLIQVEILNISSIPQ